jgi:COP9 signalosome complex subunit 4
LANRVTREALHFHKAENPTKFFFLYSTTSFLKMNIESRLQDCVSLPQQKEKIDAFRSILNDILSSPDQGQHLQDYIEAVLDDQVGLVVARQLLLEFIALFSEKITDHNVQKQLLLYAIERAQPRAVSFEESVSIIKVYKEGNGCLI